MTFIWVITAANLLPKSITDTSEEVGIGKSWGIGNPGVATSGKTLSAWVIMRQLFLSSARHVGHFWSNAISFWTQVMQWRWPQEAIVPFMPQSIGSMHTGQSGRCVPLVSCNSVAAIKTKMVLGMLQVGSTHIERTICCFEHQECQSLIFCIDPDWEKRRVIKRSFDWSHHA